MGTVLTSTDDGVSWVSRTSGIRNVLYGVSCPSASTCVAVGDSIILTGADGGVSWTGRHTGIDIYLTGVNCPSTSIRVAVGEDSMGLGGNSPPDEILTTTDGGASWTSQTSGTSSNRNGVYCPSTHLCVAVGGGGTILEWQG